MGEYSVLILVTLFGFIGLAYILLAPVYRFLDREQEASKKWTPERIAERLREREASRNGSESDDVPASPSDNP